MLRTGLYLICGFLVLCGAGCAKSGAAAREITERGSALYRSAYAAEQTGDIDEAIRLYNKVLIDEPKSFSAHFQLATLLHDYKEDYVGAIYHYNQYLYLRPESDKSTLAKERVRIAEQLLAPQILRKVGDSVQGISQAHLLKENDRLNRVITSLEGEKSHLAEAKGLAEKELEGLRAENARLRDILAKMRVEEGAVPPPSGSLLKRVEDAVRRGADDGSAAPKTDAKTLRALRDEAAALASETNPVSRKPLVAVPSTEDMLKKVQTRLTGEPEPEKSAGPAAAAEKEKGGKSGKFALSELSPFGGGEKKEKAAKSGEQRTYVVQPGDTLFRVAEKFYGDSAHWKKIKDANRGRIDPDGRLRAGQTIVVP